MALTKALRQPPSAKKVRAGLWAIIILFLLALWYDFPAQYNSASAYLENKIGVSIGRAPAPDFHLGLDLRGGAHLVYEVDTSKVADAQVRDAVNGARDVIERRVNALGVAEAVVQTNRVGEVWRIIAELPNVQDVNEAIRAIGETPILEFKELRPNGAPELTAEQTAQIANQNREAQERAKDILRQARGTPEKFAELAKEKSEDTLTKEKGGELGFLGPGSEFDPLYRAGQKLAVGAVHREIIETEGALNIIKLLAKRTGERKVAAYHLLKCFAGATNCEKTVSKDEAKAAVEALKAKLTPQNFSELAKAESDEPGATTSGGYLNYVGANDTAKPFEDAVFAQKIETIIGPIETEFGYHLIYKTDDLIPQEVNVARILVRLLRPEDIVRDQWISTGLSGKQLERATLQFDQTTGARQVGLEFNKEGADLFAALTKRNLNKPVAIFLDGQPISAPIVQSEIFDGRAVISGNFTLDQAKQLAQRLNAGALPLPVSLVGQKTIGPTLGSVSLQKSLFAGLIGFFILALFMIFYYRLPGLLAVVALIVYTALSLAIFKFIPITLTLAGITGFILSIGMAVDANVLVFERMKEELRLGKSIRTSLEEAFPRAWMSIRDSNVSSLITCAILGWYGTSIVKGFAITLAIGILISMFTAITVTRILLRLILPRLTEASKFILK